MFKLQNKLTNFNKINNFAYEADNNWIQFNKELLIPTLALFKEKVIIELLDKNHINENEMIFIQHHLLEI